MRVLINWLYVGFVGLILLPISVRAGELKPDWRIEFSSANTSLESRAAFVAPGSDLHILGLQHPLNRGKDRSEDRGWIGVFSTDGKVRQEFSFSLSEADRSVRDVDAFLFDDTGSYLVAGVGQDGQSLLASVAAGQGPKLIRKLGDKRITFLIRLADGDILIGGREARDLYAARLKYNGDLIWENRVDRGRDDLLLTGVAGADGPVVMEHSGTREQFFMRDAVLGVTALRDAASLSAKPVYSAAGRAGALVGDGAGYSLLLDTGVGVAQNLIYIRLDSSFKQVIQRELAPVNFSLERAKIARRQGGGYLVAGLDGTKVSVMRLQADGSLESKVETEPGRVFLHPDVVGVESNFVIATEVKERNSGQGLSKFIYIAKYSAK